MANRVTTLMLILVLVLSSTALGVSLTSGSVSEAEHSTIPNEAFRALGTRIGVGFGNWELPPGSGLSLTIFSYPGGDTSSGWDGYWTDMLVTITVQVDSAAGVDVYIRHLDATGTQITTIISVAGFQSTTFTGQIYDAELNNPSDYNVPNGHYFVIRDRRV